MTIGTLVLFSLCTAGGQADDRPPEAYPAEVIDLSDAPPSDPVIDMLEAIAEQNVRLNERLDEMQKLIEERTRKEPERLFEIGTGLMLRQGDLGRFVLEGNVKYLSAYLLAKSGVGLGFAPTIDAWRFRIRPLSTGLLWYFDRHETLTARNIPRNWDFLVSTGTDVVVWRGLQVRFQVLWSFPNPSDVGRYASNRAKAHWRELQRKGDRRKEEVHGIDDVDDPERIGEAAGDDLETFGDDLKGDADIFSTAYKQAGRRPFYVLGLRWEF